MNQVSFTLRRHKIFRYLWMTHDTRSLAFDVKGQHSVWSSSSILHDVTNAKHFAVSNPLELFWNAAQQLFMALHVQWKYYDLPAYRSQDMKNTATAVVGIISLVTRRSVWRIVALQLLQLRRMHDHRQVKTTLDPKCLKWHARNMCLHL
jgi:hypothetical protein